MSCSQHFAHYFAFCFLQPSFPPFLHLSLSVCCLFLHFPLDLISTLFSSFPHSSLLCRNLSFFRFVFFPIALAVSLSPAEGVWPRHQGREQGPGENRQEAGWEEEVDLQLFLQSAYKITALLCKSPIPTPQSPSQRVSTSPPSIAPPPAPMAQWHHSLPAVTVRDTDLDLASLLGTKPWFFFPLNWVFC